eukprot:1434793-Rhodomonas_salina.1
MQDSKQDTKQAAWKLASLLDYKHSARQTAAAAGRRGDVFQSKHASAASSRGMYVSERPVFQRQQNHSFGLVQGWGQERMGAYRGSTGSSSAIAVRRGAVI